MQFGLHRSYAVLLATSDLRYVAGVSGTWTALAATPTVPLRRVHAVPLETTPRHLHDGNITLTGKRACRKEQKLLVDAHAIIRGMRRVQ